MIEVNTIGTNRYAPENSAAINLYGYDYASNLTLTQLIQAVCIRTAAMYEAQSVTKMNMMTAGSQTPMARPTGRTHGPSASTS